MFRAQIRVEIKKLIGDDLAFHIERPENAAHGDYSSNVALVLAKKEGKNPREVAEDIKNKLLGNPVAKWLEKIEIAGPGFLNFWVTKEALVKNLIDILEKKENYGKSKLLSGKKVIVEYTDPNPFKEFHIGHLMSNSIGESLARIIGFNGAEVKRANYQGDVGLHIAKALAGFFSKATDIAKKYREMDRSNPLELEKMMAQIFEAYAYGSKKYEEDNQFKKKVLEINKKIYDRSDKDINKWYDLGRQTSLDYFEEVYDIIGMIKNADGRHFDYYFFESETGKVGKEIVEKNIGKAFEKSEGAIVYRGEKDGLHTRVFINSEGLPTYEAKELGLAVLKHEKYPFDLSFVVTGNEVKDYFRVVLAAEKQIYPELVEKTKHVPHGMLRLPGGKMSSRTGDVVPARSFYDGVRDKLFGWFAQNEMVPKDKLKETLDMVTLGAIKYSILHNSIGSDIIFDFEKSLALEGDSGPYIQYVYARANSVLEKAKDAGISMSLDNPPETMGGPEAILIHFPDIVELAYENLNPNIITRYLQELAGAFNAFYEKQQIIGVPESPYFVTLTCAVSIVIKNGLNLLGIAAPEKM